MEATATYYQMHTLVCVGIGLSALSLMLGIFSSGPLLSPIDIDLYTKEERKLLIKQRQDERDGNYVIYTMVFIIGIGMIITGGTNGPDKQKTESISNP